MLSCQHRYWLRRAMVANVLDTDASDTALGAVLQQEQGGKLHVIGYASRTLSASEARTLLHNQT